MPKIGLTLAGMARCPHCSIANPLLEYQSFFTQRDMRDDTLHSWFSYRCSSCESLVGAFGFMPSSQISQATTWLCSHPAEAILVIPEPQSVDQDLPERPRRYLEQALNSLHSPEGAIMLAGSAIDAMLKLKGYVAGTVNQRIKQAVDDHVLTDGMSEWAHAVRLESNKPRHADLEEPHASSELAQQTIKFAQALGEFLFVLPARIERGKADSKLAAQS